MQASGILLIFAGPDHKDRHLTHDRHKPLISIITITFNAAAELLPTMESVAHQTFKGFEHLINDGASTDNTLELARKSGTKSLRILSEPDNGLYDAMNKGLRMRPRIYPSHREKRRFLSRQTSA